jgi:hypothetical protein
MRPSRTSPARDTCGWRRVICWGQTNWDLTAFSCGFLNCRPYLLLYALAQPLPNAYGVPVLQPKVAVARPLPWEHIPRNVSTPTGLRPIRRSPIRPGRNRFAVQSLLTPRVGLIPFGRPWAGGRKPFGLGGRPPFRHLPRGGWGAAGVICWGQTNWDLTAFSCGFLNCRPYWFFYALAKRLPNAYGVPILQPKVAVARPLPWDHIPRNVSTPTGLRPIRRSPIRPGRNRLAVQSLLHSLPG